LTRRGSESPAGASNWREHRASMGHDIDVGMTRTEYDAMNRIVGESQSLICPLNLTGCSARRCIERVVEAVASGALEYLRGDDEGGSDQPAAPAPRDGCGEPSLSQLP
jgi:hypothetical protein